MVVVCAVVLSLLLPFRPHTCGVIRNLAPEPVYDLLDTVGLSVATSRVFANLGGMLKYAGHCRIRLSILASVFHFGVDGDVLYVGLAVSKHLFFGAIVKCDGVCESKKYFHFYSYATID